MNDMSPQRMPNQLSDERIAAIMEGREQDPFGVLGVHRDGARFKARAFLPDARAVEAFTLDGKPLGRLASIHPGGLFEGFVKLKEYAPIRYRIAYDGGDHWAGDPYSFGPVLGPMDDYFMAEGSHLRLYDKLGSRVMTHEGADGVHFAVWAPNARRVSLVSDSNSWDGRRNIMRLRRDSGVWEIFIPDIGPGVRYKYEIEDRDGVVLPQKVDPFAFQTELRPNNASVVASRDRHSWKDEPHRNHWSNVEARRQPISIYEVHPGSWRRDPDGNFLHWDALADQLIPYVVDMGFTHIEFLPVMEHPYDPSWGYQVTGMFAPSARFGEPEGFARFVEGAHKAGLGVIVDWVPAHFPMDAHGLRHFDGTSLYEYHDPKEGFHPDWSTAIYNFSRTEVSAFLINSALYWADKYHVDGLRVDAVASMLYRDYSREEGEWIPNQFGGRENLEAVEFLKRMNKEFYAAHPNAFTVAEESTAWPGVSQPMHEGGLGFGFKWNMGFMHDTLQYLARDPIHRKHHHGEINFGLAYAFSENFVLPLSHDEVVHGKGSLLNKMPGSDEEKFATLRAYYAFMWGHPGKKLLFMGQEFAQREEWREDIALDWWLLDHGPHEGMRRLVRDLNNLYKSQPALHARDCEAEGFEWLIEHAAEDSVFGWARHAPDADPVVVVSHFTPVTRTDYPIRLPRPGKWKEVLNSDAQVYGGSGVGNLGVVEADENGNAKITIPPLGVIMLQPMGND